jgi:hypothetical protein
VLGGVGEGYGFIFQFIARFNQEIFPRENWQTRRKISLVCQKHELAIIGSY